MAMRIAAVTDLLMFAKRSCEASRGCNLFVAIEGGAQSLRALCRLAEMEVPCSGESVTANDL